MPSSVHLILASTSPRRQAFIKLLDMPFSVISPADASGTDVDETPLANESPLALVKRLSQRKAETVTKNLAHTLAILKLEPFNALVVIGSDTEVALNNQVLGKPASPQDATRMLASLRSQPHQVYSGLTVIHLTRATGSSHFYTVSSSTTRVQQTNVWMRPYSDREIAAYVATGSPMDKAGGYGIQDRDFEPVARLEGCFASVMGFPLGELADIFAKLEIMAPDPAHWCHQHTQAPCCRANSPA